MLKEKIGLVVSVVFLVVVVVALIVGYLDSGNIENGRTAVVIIYEIMCIIMVKSCSQALIKLIKK